MDSTHSNNLGHLDYTSLKPILDILKISSNSLSDSIKIMLKMLLRKAKLVEHFTMCLDIGFLKHDTRLRTVSFSILFWSFCKPSKLLVLLGYE